jgi:hypothetical protein
VADSSAWRSSHADTRLRAPHSDRDDVRPVDPLNASADGLAAARRVGASENLPLAALVHQTVADPKLHRKDLGEGGAIGVYWRITVVIFTARRIVAARLAARARWPARS